MTPRGKVKPSSTFPSVLFPQKLPLLRVRFYGLEAGIVQPFLGNASGALTVGAGFDGFERDGQITFTRSPARARAVALCPALQVFVGRGDGAFNRPRRLGEIGFQVQQENRMPVEVPALNQFY